MTLPEVCRAANQPFTNDQQLQKPLALFQIPPLPGGQIAQNDTTHANPFQAYDLPTDLFGHATELHLFAFLKDDTQFIPFLPFHRSKTQRLAITPPTAKKSGT